ncbi:MAG TPA: hypothetical protein PLL10_07385, partial [Elusimicrobiales bacterium]|nr:hypothetical protein [Elusimicrobiales bacterium]
MLISSALLWGFAFAESKADKTPQAEVQEVFTPEQLRQLKEKMTLPRPGQSAPPVYPWMLRRDLQRADWLNLPYKGKTLYEPINVIICDSASVSAEDAEKKLLAACEKAGFMDRYGHSSDYYAYIAGNLVRPFPARRRHSLADKPFEKTNNHGRIFGP